ncbi:MAG: phosphate acyltransferase PlsX [Actinobacteria bacterium]|nr:phosphate acyltransferase PlsX [Actinomycetota bacterium]
MKLPVAIDAMGGDKAPSEIVAGARQAMDEGLSVVLVGRPDAIGDVGDIRVVEATEVIAMDDEPGKAVRTKKDSSLVRTMELVRDGKACAAFSAGNTGAGMASALLRLGRLEGVARPAIATPIPVPGATPTLLLDAGANAECSAEWLVQFAQMGAAFSRVRFGIDNPRVGLLSIGEEETKGSPLVKDTHKLLKLTTGINFIGNVEGRDILTDDVDVVVTDGFTGNVALKTLEGAMKFLIGKVFEAIMTDDDTKAAGNVLLPALAPTADALDPDSTGGAALVGLKGLALIGHGSSSAKAVVNAVRIAHELAAAKVVDALAASVAPR